MRHYIAVTLISLLAAIAMSAMGCGKATNVPVSTPESFVPSSHTGSGNVDNKPEGQGSTSEPTNLEQLPASETLAEDSTRIVDLPNDGSARLVLGLAVSVPSETLTAEGTGNSCDYTFREVWVAAGEMYQYSDTSGEFVELRTAEAMTTDALAAKFNPLIFAKWVPVRDQDVSAPSNGFVNIEASQELSIISFVIDDDSLTIQTDNTKVPALCDYPGGGPMVNQIKIAKGFTSTSTFDPNAFTVGDLKAILGASTKVLLP